MENILPDFEQIILRVREESLSKGKPRNLEIILEQLNLCRLLLREEFSKVTLLVDLSKIQDMPEFLDILKTMGPQSSHEWGLSILKQKMERDLAEGKVTLQELSQETIAKDEGGSTEV